jgi:ribonuclease HI
MNVTVICDGASRGNPGPGGWGAIVATPKEVRELGGYAAFTTNNKMELVAATEGLRAVPTEATAVTVYTDSSYVAKGMTEWLAGWITRDWKTMAKKPVENAELWRELADVADKLTSGGAVISWTVVPGHAGIPANERVDAIATSFADSSKPALFNGSREKYTVSLDLTIPQNILKKKSKSSSSQPAYSYVSEINGDVQVHKTWEECKARVHGKKARFKKVFSADEERELIAEWSS